MVTIFIVLNSVLFLAFLVAAIIYDRETRAAFKKLDADAIAVLEAALESDEKYAKEKIKYVLQLVKGKL